jgi:hypothetical protein
LSVHRHWDSELDRGGHPGVHAAQRGVPTHPSYACTTGSATQGPRRCAFYRVSSASGAGDTRLRRRAPGAGIPAGAATGGSRVTGSVDAMLHSTRRRCDGSRRQVDMWTLRWCEHSTGGWLNNGNLAGEDTPARSRGDWGKTAPTSGPHLSATVAR